MIQFYLILLVKELSLSLCPIANGAALLLYSLAFSTETWPMILKLLQDVTFDQEIFQKCHTFMFQLVVVLVLVLSP